MANEMGQLKETATTHMLRDIQDRGKWSCECEACTNIRPLTDMEKALDVRPLIRELRRTEEQMQQLDEGPEKKAVQEHYFNLHDQIAQKIAK
jgi:hypothetical protein